MILLLLSTICYGQFQIDWQQSYGGMGIDIGFDIVQVQGGFLIAGFTNSNSGLVTCNINDYGVLWLIKIDVNGNLLWQKCYENSDAFRMVKAIKSQHFYLIGGAIADPYPNTYNLGIKKIDSLGNIIWERALGNTIGILNGDQYGEPTFDGGVIATAQIDSRGGDITNWYGGYDGWIIKLDSLGNTEWDISVGSSQFEFINGIIQTSDSGYIAGLYGTPNGVGGNIDCDIQSISYPDAIVIKMDVNGNPEWQRCYGGSGHEGVTRLLELEDGYLISGWGGSNDGDLVGSGWHGDQDVWLVKIDYSGNIIWQKCYGGSNGESPERIFLNDDGGIIVFANTYSFDGDVVGNPSNSPENPSIWIFKVDSIGNLLWQRCIGGRADERVYGVAKESDYKYTITGEMNFSPSGDVNCSNFVYGSQKNYWVFVINDTSENIVESLSDLNEVKIYPNPANTILNINLPIKYGICKNTIEIIDITGICLIKSNPETNLSQLDLKELKPGLYIVKIQNGEMLMTKRIVIQ